MRRARTSTIFALRVRRVGDDPGLRARQRDRLVAEILDRHLREGAGDALADGDEHVHRARLRALRETLCARCDELVGRVAHRREHADDAVALLARGDEPPDDAQQPLDVAHRRAAELHRRRCCSRSALRRDRRHGLEIRSRHRPSVGRAPCGNQCGASDGARPRPASRSCGATSPTPSRARAAARRASAPAASAAPTCTSSTASCPTRSCRSCRATRSSASRPRTARRRRACPVARLDGRRRAATAARGRENLCDGARFTGYTLDGGYAEYAVADERFCSRRSRRATTTQARPAPVRGPDRLPLAAHDRRRRAARPLRLRRVGAPRSRRSRAGRGGACSPSPAPGDDEAPALARSTRRRVGGRLGRGAARGARRGDHLRPGRRARPGGARARSRRAARWSAPASTCPTSRRSRTSSSGASARSARSRT